MPTSSNTYEIHVAFIGLGVMGFPMAAHLLKKGYRVTVYNRTSTKAQQWLKQNPQGTIAATPQQAAQNADFVFSCVGNDHDLREVTIGDKGAFQAMKPGAIFIDHTTTSADVAKELAHKALQHQIHFLDAPISGGQSGAEQGILTIMVGGEAPVFKQAQPVMSAYARAVTLMGPAGSGQLTKMVNQICMVGIIQGLAEGIAFGERAGLDMPKVLEVISKGACGSWQLDNRGKTMIANQFDFGFAVDWVRKDLGFALEMAKRTGATLPITALIDQFYASVQAQGAGREDTSSLIKLLSRTPSSSLAEKP